MDVCEEVWCKSVNNYLYYSMFKGEHVTFCLISKSLS